MNWIVGHDEEDNVRESEDEPIPDDVVLRVDNAVHNARQKSANDFEISLQSSPIAW